MDLTKKTELILRTVADTERLWSILYQPLYKDKLVQFIQNGYNFHVVLYICLEIVKSTYKKCQLEVDSIITELNIIKEQGYLDKSTLQRLQISHDNILESVRSNSDNLFSLKNGLLVNSDRISNKRDIMENNLKEKRNKIHRKCGYFEIAAGAFLLYDQINPIVAKSKLINIQICLPLVLLLIFVALLLVNYRSKKQIEGFINTLERISENTNNLKCQLEELSADVEELMKTLITRIEPFLDNNTESRVEAEENMIYLNKLITYMEQAKACFQEIGDKAQIVQQVKNAESQT